MRRALLALVLLLAAGCSSGNVTTTLGRQEAHAEAIPALTLTSEPPVCWIEREAGGESGIYGGDASLAPTGPAFIAWTTCPDGPFTP